MNKLLKTTLLLMASLFFLMAEEKIEPQYRWGLETAYYFPHHGTQAGFDPVNYGIAAIPQAFMPINGDEGRQLGTGWGALELQGWVDGSLVIPMLKGTSALTKGNHLKITEKINLSPATVGSTTTFTLTPIAFLNFQQGNHVGTGWKFPIANGLGLNNDGSGNPKTEHIPGLVYRGWLSGTFQFDLAAVLPEPGDWSHIVLQTNHKLQYQHFTAAGPDDPWQYEADNGQNFNGFEYITSSMIGVMIPWDVINFAGIMVDTENYLFDAAQKSTVSSGGWGSDFTTVKLGALCNWQIDDSNSMIILAQFKNAPLYTDDTVHYNYFLNRKATGEAFFYFDRIALSYTMKLP